MKIEESTCIYIHTHTYKSFLISTRSICINFNYGILKHNTAKSGTKSNPVADKKLGKISPSSNESLYRTKRNKNQKKKGIESSEEKVSIDCTSFINTCATALDQMVFRFGQMSNRPQLSTI